MSRYIDVEPMRDEWMNEVNENIFCPNDFLDSIDNQPDADVEPKRKWIPCSVRLPDKEFEDFKKTHIKAEVVPILATVKKKKLGGKYYFVSDKSFYDPVQKVFDDIDCNRQEVIAWMPLPEPFDPESVK